MLDAIDLKPEKMNCNELSNEYHRLGLSRVRHLYSLKKDGQLKAVLLANVSDIGLNLSDITNCVKVFVTDKVELSDEEQQQLDMMKMMFATATWKTVYNFPRKVKSVDNDNSSIAKNGKTVTTSVGLIDLMEGKANLDEKIRLKRR